MPGQEMCDSTVDGELAFDTSDQHDVPTISSSVEDSGFVVIEAESCTKPKVRRQPPNTLAYRVKSNDKLMSIAAFNDTTPSVLKKINKLTIDFLYPDQVLYIPYNSGIECTNSNSSGSACHSEVHTDSDLYSGSSYEEDRVPASSPVSPAMYPEPPHRHLDNDVESSLHPPYRTTANSGVIETVSTDVEKSLIQMFVKLPAKYIPVDQGEVTGTLLVTPNAVMFDPNVSDPLVLEMGAEEFGMIAKLDTLISVAIYRDSQAMRDLQQQRVDPTVCKPEIYYMGECSLLEEHVASSDILENGKGDDGASRADYSHSCSCSVASSATWKDNSQNAPTTNEPARVKFDLDNDDITESSPIDIGHAAIDTANLDEFGFNEDLDEKISQSIETQISTFAKKFGHCRNASTASSLYSVGITSNTEIYVDYSCGMFAGGSSVSNSGVNPINQLSSNGSCAVTQSNDDCSGAGQLACQSDDCCDGNAHGKRLFPVHLHSMFEEEKPDLFQPISDLVHDASNSQELWCEPFYLCLQVGKPIQTKDYSDTCPIEAYKKQRKPEYWFSIPGDKVDAVYQFFIQWRPELYGEEITDKAILASKGFVVIPDSYMKTSESCSLPCSPMVRQLSHARVLKDWEILSLDEMERRKSLLDIEKYLPFPQMSGKSLLLTEEDIRHLAVTLPIRVEGHRWRLVYSNDEHGFSLQTLYRKTCELDSSTILVVQDENEGLFGAFSSVPIHLCEQHFYGNGECFLFTFIDGYKTYKWMSKNMFCVQGSSQGLTIGTGSATCGLWLDADLYHGRTQHCDTFDNDPLTGCEEDFIIKGIEVWSLGDEESDYD